MKFIKKNKDRILILILVMSLMTIFYFIVKLVQGKPLFLNNSLDSIIPFIPQFVYFYILWFPFLLLVPLILLKYNKKIFDTYLVTIFIYTVIELIIFLIMPTTMERAVFNVNSASTWILNIVYTVDTPVRNLFPSGHCAYSFLFIMSVLELKSLDKRYKILISIGSILIVMSTILIKQHVLIDVAGALIIVPIYFILRKKKINIEGSAIYAKIFCKKQNK